MTFAQFSDAFVFAMAVVHNPHLRRLQHPGHLALLVSWMRAMGKPGLPAFDRVLAGVLPEFRSGLALIEPRVSPLVWSMNGVVGDPLYREVPSGPVGIGLLSVPVMREEEPMAVLGMFGVPCAAPVNVRHPNNT